MFRVLLQHMQAELHKCAHNSNATDTLSHLLLQFLNPSSNLRHFLITIIKPCCAAKIAGQQPTKFFPKRRSVVYFNKLSGACSTCKLIETLFFSRFQPFLLFFVDFSQKITEKALKWTKKVEQVEIHNRGQKLWMKKSTTGSTLPLPENNVEEP